MGGAVVDSLRDILHYWVSELLVSDQPVRPLRQIPQKASSLEDTWLTSCFDLEGCAAHRAELEGLCPGPCVCGLAR